MFFQSLQFKKIAFMKMSYIKPMCLSCVFHFKIYLFFIVQHVWAKSGLLSVGSRKQSFLYCYSCSSSVHQTVDFSKMNRNSGIWQWRSKCRRRCKKWWDMRILVLLFIYNVQVRGFFRFKELFSRSDSDVDSHEEISGYKKGVSVTG